MGAALRHQPTLPWIRLTAEASSKMTAGFAYSAGWKENGPIDSQRLEGGRLAAVEPGRTYDVKVRGPR